MLIRPPQFENYPSFTDLQDIGSYANMPLLDLAEKLGSQKHLATICRQLRFLTAQMLDAGSSNGPISESEMMTFCDARSLIEHSLLSMSATAAAGRSPDMDSLESQRLAALIYLNAVLRNCSPNGALMQSLRKQLMDAILAVKEPGLFFSLRPRTAIWIYSMGGLVSLEDTDRQWFAGRIARLTANVKIDNWEEAKRTHRDAVWVDELKTKSWNSLWGEVQEIRMSDSSSKGAAGACFEYLCPSI